MARVVPVTMLLRIRIKISFWDALKLRLAGAGRLPEALQKKLFDLHLDDTPPAQEDETVGEAS